MKTIIEMASEAGIFNGDGDWSSCREEYEGVVKKFAELVRADEREACAMNVWIVSLLAQQPDADDKGVYGWLQEAEDQIRARGNT